LTLGAEAALVRGPLSFQGEYFYSTVNQPVGPGLSFSGFYGYASWFLTGDAGTVGLNWYWTALLKTRFNWDIAGVSGRRPNGVLPAFQVRFELDF
jgi:phosphate-selective porin